MKLCAGRVGQVINLSSLGNDCGINHNTIKAWLSFLQASYVIFLLYPYYKNYGKRLIKSPKLYFIDTGLMCSLLSIFSSNEITHHYLRGGLIESYIMSDLLKQQYNRERQPNLYFWRDHLGREIDCIVDTSTGPIPIEIKGGKTVNQNFFSELENWQKLTKNIHHKSYLVYSGNSNQTWPSAQVISWNQAGTLISDFETS